MKKMIVTTTIYPPSKSLMKFSELKDWSLLVVGDRKTPHHQYENIDCIYMSPEDQERKYPDLSRVIGWNKIQRRNIGFVEAYHLGADIIATVDDDNIPYDKWGEGCVVGEEIECDLYTTKEKVFDPLSVTSGNHLWHRGYPVDMLEKRNNVEYHGKVKRKVLIQADLWDGDPDIDAMARLVFRPILKFEQTGLFCSNTISPFNSQNTFLHRSVIPFYAVIPYIGRMDDIWGSYIVQKKFPGSLVYNSASVYQERNPQDLIKNLQDEILGYRHTLDFIQSDMSLEKEYIPDEALEFYNIYKNSF